MRTLLVSLVVASLSISMEARADEGVAAAKATPAQRNVITIPNTIVYGRWVRPCVSVEIDRIAPAFTSTETSLPLLDRIEGTVYGALFF